MKYKFKYVLVGIYRRIPKPGEGRMRYPDIYDPIEVESTKIGPIVYDSRLQLGEDREECLVYLREDIADKYARDPEIRIVSEPEANQWLADNPKLKRRGEEYVADVNRVQGIAAKIAAGMPLTRDDRDALDPNKKTPGINKVPRTVKDFFA